MGLVEDNLLIILFVVALGLQFVFLYEVILQLRLQKTLLTLMPNEVFDRLPPFSRTNKTILFSSPKFQSAFWKYIWMKSDLDDPPIAQIKVRIRKSIARKIIAAILGLGMLVYLLVTTSA